MSQPKLKGRVRRDCFLDVQVTYPGPERFRYRITTQRGAHPTPMEIVTTLEETAAMIREAMQRREQPAEPAEPTREEPTR